MSSDYYTTTEADAEAYERRANPPEPVDLFEILDADEIADVWRKRGRRW